MQIQDYQVLVLDTETAFTAEGPTDCRTESMVSIVLQC